MTKTPSKAKTAKAEKPARKPPKKGAKGKTAPKKNPFAARATADTFLSEEFDAYRQRHERQMKLLEEQLEQVQEQIKETPKGKSTTALNQARTAILSQMKTYETSYRDFLLELMRRKDLLQSLNPPKEAGEAKQILKFILPDFADVQVVDTPPRPNDDDPEADRDIDEKDDGGESEDEKA